MVKKSKTGKDQLLEKIKGLGIIGPFGLAVIGFLLGGPITAVILFLIWKTKWPEKAKICFTVIFVVFFNLLQIIFAKQLISMTYQNYNNLLKSLEVTPK